MRGNRVDCNIFWAEHANATDRLAKEGSLTIGELARDAGAR